MKAAFNGGYRSAVGELFSLSLDFMSEKLGPDILWFNPPAKYQLRCNGSSGVKIFSVSYVEVEITSR